MNYKLTSRERSLIKLMGILILLFIIYLVELRIFNSLQNSRESLTTQVESFNDIKQQLSQLDAYESNSNIQSATSEFTKYLTEKNYTYDNNNGVLDIKMLSETNLFDLFEFIYNKNLNINFVNMSLVSENNITLSINFDT